MTLLTLVPLVLGFLALVPFLWRAWRRSRARRAWRAMAPRLELLLGSEGNRRLLVGRYQHHPVEVLLASDGTARLCMKAAGNAFPAGLHLFPQGPAPHRFRRQQDIQVGEPALDAAFMIQGQNPAAVIRLLREPDVGPTLLALQADNPRAILLENEVVASLAYPLEEEAGRRTLRSLDRVVSALERAARHQREAVAQTREQTLREASEEPSRPRPMTPRDNPWMIAERKTRDEFQRRVRQHLFFAELPMTLAFFSGVGGFLTAKLGAPEMALLSMAGIGVFMMMGFVGSAFSQAWWMRCPACDERLQDLRQGKSVLRYATDFSSCPHCKARLR